MKNIILGLLSLAFLAPMQVLAISSNASETAQQRNSTITETSDAATGTTTQVRNCNGVKTRLAAKYQSYESGKQLHTQAYDNLLTRLNRFSANIKAKGYNTDTLDADIATLTAKINEFKTLTATSYLLMQQTAEGACTTQGADAIKSSLAQIRNRVRLAHQKAADIRDYYRSVIKEDLKELKLQNPGAVSNTTTNSGVEAE